MVRRNSKYRPKDERIEELHAELPVADPDVAVGVGQQRSVIDEHRPAADELNIVRRCVRQSEAVLQQLELQIEMMKGRRFVE